MYALAVKKDRQPPAGSTPTNEEKQRLFDTMIAYAGTYTLHDDRVIHHVDASWNQAWTGTDQLRFYTLEGDVLAISTSPLKDTRTGQEVIGHTVLRRIIQISN
jgi:hypothetical protein